MNNLKLSSLKVDFNSNNKTTYMTHNFHPYPAKFIPQIPKKAIEELTKEDEIVMDPFCGCGTALVEAKLLNRKAIGLDSHPLACLISQVKTTKIENLDLVDDIIKSIKSDINKFYQNNLKRQINLPIFHNIDHWFKKFVQYELAIIKDNILKINDKDVANFLKVALSSIIVQVSNQESDTRYAAIDKGIGKKEVFNLFEKKVSDMKKRIMEFNINSSNNDCRIYNSDARIIKEVSDNSVDLVVTSPPYANTYDYYLYHKFRMLWLDMDFRKTQELEFGSRYIHNDLKKDIEHYNNNLLKCLKEINRVLKENKYMCIVIGDSIIRKEFIDINPIMIELGKKSGFGYIGEFSHSLKAFTRTFNPRFTNDMKKEHIMFFKKVLD